MKTIERMKRLVFYFFAPVVFAQCCGPSDSEMLDAEALNKELCHQAKSGHSSGTRGFMVYSLRGYRIYQYRKGPARVQVTDVIYDRYLLTMDVDIEVDGKARSITRYGDPSIQLNEVTAVVNLADGESNKLWR